jgi:hypothetical protein
MLFPVALTAIGLTVVAAGIFARERLARPDLNYLCRDAARDEVDENRQSCVLALVIKTSVGG